MEKLFHLYIIDPQGEMRCTSKYWCTVKDLQQKYFKDFQTAVHREYPGSQAGWLEIEQSKQKRSFQ